MMGDLFKVYFRYLCSSLVLVNNSLHLVSLGKIPMLKERETISSCFRFLFVHSGIMFFFLEMPRPSSPNDKSFGIAGGLWG